MTPVEEVAHLQAEVEAAITLSMMCLVKLLLEGEKALADSRAALATQVALEGLLEEIWETEMAICPPCLEEAVGQERHHHSSTGTGRNSGALCTPSTSTEE